ncbi:ATP-dependent DNA helicase DinG [Fredinandcohnia sp. 179-A 10B2 NHS]|uniref:ATP-dependent DNA helicase DinG n=1 Tax=Fredinandcohnia sp. 179-A 10B2 NHS TaxID=3235176 RepID=UPI0039A368C2
MKERFVVVDLETTGNAPKKGDRIIQFAAVVIEDGEIIERFATFVNPGRKVPVFIEQLTGINDDVVANAPDFSLVAPEIISMCKDSYFVAHNVPFDYSFLQEELSNSGYPNFECLTIDTVELSRVMMPLEDSYKLGQLAESLSLSHENPHQADSDAEVTAEILLKILEKMNNIPLVTLQKLYTLSKHFKSDIVEILSNIIEKKLSVANDSQHYDIFRGIALRRQPKLNKVEKVDINRDSLSTYIKDFPFRNGQRKILDFILHAFETHQHALIEAGTGIGKSIAYLLPSIFIAKIKGRCIISTNTLQLQQQLIEKEIELARSVLPFPFTAELLKGKGNYLSLRRFEQVLYESSNNYDEILAKSQILVWLTETQTGDIDEINLPSGGMLLWERVKCTQSHLKMDDSIWNSRCFYEKARKAAEKADVLIINHALLLRDISSGNTLLPQYNRVIIDEAHHLEVQAKKHVGTSTSFLTIHTSLSLLGHLETDHLVAKAKKIFNKTGFEIQHFNLINQLLKDIRVCVNDLFRTLRNHVLEMTNDHTTTNRVQYLLSKNETGKYWDEVIENLLALRLKKRELFLAVQRQETLITSLITMITPLQQGVLNDYLNCFDVMDGDLRSLENVLTSYGENEIIWIELDPKGPVNSANIYVEPSDISDYLADQFFANKESVIMTSATLTVDNSFEYSIERNGLLDFNPITLSVPSPFNYTNQAAVMIPTDVPLINSVSLEEYVQLIAKQIAEIAIKTKGRMLVLFTSYEMLRQTFNSLKELPMLEEFVLIAQSISSGSRAKLTKNFQAFEKAILLGTNSFWEGVDIPGEDLSALVIMRLPFTSPNDPIFELRAKRIEESGGDSFRELSLPEAVIRFKQGVGRLIRSENDKGIIFIMDRRIVTTRYGNKFLSSIPPMKVIQRPLKQLIVQIDDWIN